MQTKSLYFEVRPLDHEPPAGGTFFVAWLDRQAGTWQNAHPDRQQLTDWRADDVLIYSNDRQSIGCSTFSGSATD